MKIVQKNRLKTLRDNLNKLSSEKINLVCIKVDLKDELTLLYYSIPIIFPDDFKSIGADIIHNKSKLDFYEMCEDFFGIDEFTKYLLFYDDSDINKNKLNYNIEKNNNLTKIKKNIDKILAKKF
jgi:hypothetical protein